jgi:hypothetical protein
MISILPAMVVFAIRYAIVMERSIAQALLRILHDGRSMHGRTSFHRAFDSQAGLLLAWQACVI